MILYCIVRNEKAAEAKHTYQLLKKACEERNVEFIPLESDTIDYATVRETIVPGSLLYRIAGGDRSALLEALLDDQVITLRRDTVSLMARAFSWGSAIRLQQQNLPIIPTVFNSSRAHDRQLSRQVEQLGGFPIIVKSAGGSHGAGVMRIDSIESLRSVLDYISDETTSGVVLRQYIKNARHLRLVVLGDKVVDAIEYLPQPDDFRTNAVQVPQVKKHAPSDAIRDDAIRSVQALGLEFGGVDVLMNESGEHFIAEVNHPCNFARNQMNTGVDIAGAMVDHLVTKQQNKD